jgi:hypothetical protein
MKNLALFMALVFVSLPAMGQDKEPVKKPKAEEVKKAVQQPDLDALGAKLKKAVDAGKLTEKEAIAIYEKAEAGQGKSKEGAKPKAIIKPAVKPGAKPVAKPGAKQVVKPVAKQVVKPVAKPIKVDLEGLGAKLKAAVAAGKLTEEEAKAIYAKAAAGQGKSKDGAKPKAIAKPVVKPGAKPIAKSGAKPGAKSEKVDLDALLAKLKKAVDAGEITEEKAKAIYRKYEVGQVKSKAEGKPKPIAKPVKVDLAEAYEKVAREVRAAVKAGKITEVQAKQKLAAFKKQLAGKAPAKEAVKKPAAAGPNLFELFRLVEKGELTAKEAMEKYKAARAKKEFPGKKELPEKK